MECDRAFLPWQQSSEPEAALGQQPQAHEARMALAADHQVIVDGNAQRLCRPLDLPRHLDVVARRLGVMDRWLRGCPLASSLAGLPIGSDW